MAVLEIRHCADIGLWSIDRPRSSCKWASEFCKMTCYNRSIESRFRKSIPAKDARNEASWKSIDGRQLADMLDRKRTPTERIRLMTRGEAFSTPDDIARVRGHRRIRVLRRSRIDSCGRSDGRLCSTATIPRLERQAAVRCYAARKPGST
jgi:hypothetical protein